MISRKTAIALSELFDEIWSYSTRYSTIVRSSELYDFLFENDYEPWFTNMAKSLHGARAVKEWVMRLHTGETVFPATPEWTWEQRQKLGQEYLEYLANDILVHHQHAQDYYKRAWGPAVSKLRSRLDLDGYKWIDGRLLFSEAAVIDSTEAVGVLQQLARDLKLETWRRLRTS